MPDVTLVDVDSTWVNDAAVSYDAAELRRADAAGFVSTGIVRDSATALDVTVDASDQVTVTLGNVVIPGDAVSGNGVYRTGLAADTPATPLEARDATNGRVDLLVFRQLDTDVVGTHGAYTARLEVLTGVPSATPSAPALPSMAVEVAKITVPVSGGGATSVDSSGRTYACAVGGVIPVGSSAMLPASAAVGQQARTLDTGAIYEWDGTAWVNEDSGWSQVNVSTAFEHIAGNELVVRSIGNRVQIRGTARRLLGAIVPSSSATPMNSIGIPVAARPPVEVRVPINSSAIGAQMLVIVDTAGILSLQNKGTADLPVNGLCYFNGTWLTD